MIKHSKEYACHLWTKDCQLIVATEQGELLLLSYTGELVEFIKTSPGKRIISMHAYSRGIIVAGEYGQVWIYEQVQSEH
jgi:hypothetical protein